MCATEGWPIEEVSEAEVMPGGRPDTITGTVRVRLCWRGPEEVI